MLRKQMIQCHAAQRTLRRIAATANSSTKSSFDRRLRSVGYFVTFKMTCARTILPLVSALALAVLPAAGRAAVNAKSYHATEMTAAQPVDDCCRHDANECDKAVVSAPTRLAL